MDIGFAMSLVPNAKEIAQVLIDAAKITPFDIETSSIFVNGTRKIYLIQSCQTCFYILEQFLKAMHFFSLFVNIYKSVTWSEPQDQSPHCFLYGAAVMAPVRPAITSALMLL